MRTETAKLPSWYLASGRSSREDKTHSVMPILSSWTWVSNLKKYFPKPRVEVEVRPRNFVRFPQISDKEKTFFAACSVNNMSIVELQPTATRLKNANDRITTMAATFCSVVCYLTRAGEMRTCAARRASS